VTDYVFDSRIALDPNANPAVLATSASGQVYAKDDTSLTTPLTVTDREGAPKTTVHASDVGALETFVYTDPQVWWSGGGVTILLTAEGSLVDAAQSAADDAAAARSAAQDAADAVATSPALFPGGGAAGYFLVRGDAERSAEWVAPVSADIVTEDTGEAVKVIAFSDGTLRVVPASAIAPPTPTGLATDAAVSHVTVTWDASAGASGYDVYRDGVRIAQPNGPRYVDWDASPGVTVTYQVRAHNGYGQLSAPTDAVPAYTDPALNTAPTLAVTVWPATNTPGQKQVIRVAASDVDGQVLALALSVDAGSLEPTSDPSVWYLTA